MGWSLLRDLYIRIADSWHRAQIWRIACSSWSSRRLGYRNSIPCSRQLCECRGVVSRGPQVGRGQYFVDYDSIAGMLLVFWGRSRISSTARRCGNTLDVVTSTSGRGVHRPWPLSAPGRAVGRAVGNEYTTTLTCAGGWVSYSVIVFTLYHAGRQGGLRLRHACCICSCPFIVFQLTLMAS